MVQAEEYTRIQRDAYTALAAAPGVLTPEPLNPNATALSKHEVFYRSPNKIQLIAKDQHQAYFTSDSHERLQC